MELASETSGAQVTTASCIDPRFPPENIIDDNEDTMWMTTGSFPQEVIIQLPRASSIKTITTWTCNVKSISLEKCEAAVPKSWETMGKSDLSENDGRIQMETHKISPDEATFLKLKINSSWKDFAAINRISVTAGGGGRK